MNRYFYLFVISLLFSIISNPANARLRAINYGLEKLESDTINASAHGAICLLADTDTGNMIYSRQIDQKMIDQVNTVSREGGSIYMTFTLRTAFSFVGLGSGRINATVTTSVGGTVVDTITENSDGPSGTTEIHYQIPIDASAFANGGSIIVTASGNGEAYANVCGVANQAISTFYFRTGGKPMLVTNPFN